jgi:hypothetical protein
MQPFIVIALAVALTTALSPPAGANPLAPPPMPATIEAPAGHTPFFVAHAAGTQDYICAPSGAGVAWTFIGPQATLFKANLHQVATHFLSPNPFEGGIARATWQHSRDTSAVWARAIMASSDPNFVAPGAIPWLLLEVVGADEGPTRGSSMLTATTYIQRLATVGGTAPSSGCAVPADVNRRAFVPYEADYLFYELRDRAGR